MLKLSPFHATLPLAEGLYVADAVLVRATPHVSFAEQAAVVAFVLANYAGCHVMRHEVFPFCLHVQRDKLRWNQWSATVPVCIIVS